MRTSPPAGRLWTRFREPSDRAQQRTDAGLKLTPSLKTIYSLQDVSTAAGALQELYLDSEANWLRPNLTFIAQDGSIYFEINEIGLKGEAVDPSRRQAVVWGDSVGFGVGWGWPRLLDQLVSG